MSDTALIRLMQLVSPALPIGAYAYSQGLEYAVSSGWVRDEESAFEWISGISGAGLSILDLPVLIRLYGGWQRGDHAVVEDWSRFLLANRESGELVIEDSQVGRALARLLSDLDIQEALPWINHSQATLATLFSLAAVSWAIPVLDAVRGYVWMWSENQVIAAVRLVPLGQSAGQRILSKMILPMLEGVDRAFSIQDDEIGRSLPAWGLASIFHETQYTRLFRS